MADSFEPETPLQAVATFFSTILKYWKKIGQFLADLVGRVFLMLFYLTVALPYGIGYALFGDPLDIRGKHPPAWKPRQSPPATIEAARKF